MKLKKLLPITAMLLVALMPGCKKDDGLSIYPTGTSSDPLNRATGVARNKAIAFTFSEEMDPLTINATTVTLTQGATTVAGNVAYSGKTATFTPSSMLSASTAYTATITTGAKNLAGSALPENVAWSFTTVNATSVSYTHLRAHETRHDLVC